jgi:hypothetical protein
MFMVNAPSASGADGEITWMDGYKGKISLQMKWERLLTSERKTWTLEVYNKLNVLLA